jgi:hypothetical protein
MCNAYEQDQGGLPLSFSEFRIKLKMPVEGEARPREAYPRLNGKFLRRVVGERSRRRGAKTPARSTKRSAFIRTIW